MEFDLEIFVGTLTYIEYPRYLVVSIIGATQEHLCSAHLEDQAEAEDQDETKRTGVVDSSSDRSRATE